jgi:hypothetical protein
VWRRALELADSLDRYDRFAVALDLLRAAHHDPDTMAHASSLGRTRLQDRPDDLRALGAETILEAAIVLLGRKPRLGDAVAAAEP